MVPRRQGRRDAICRPLREATVGLPLPVRRRSRTAGSTSRGSSRIRSSHRCRCPRSGDPRRRGRARPRPLRGLDLDEAATWLERAMASRPSRAAAIRCGTANFTVSLAEPYIELIAVVDGPRRPRLRSATGSRQHFLGDRSAGPCARTTRRRGDPLGLTGTMRNARRRGASLAGRRIEAAAEDRRCPSSSNGILRRRTRARPAPPVSRSRRSRSEETEIA